MVRANQRGSIVGFIIVGGILALLLIGGAYFVRNNLVPANEQPATPSQEENSSGDDSEWSPVDDSDSSTENDEQTDETISLPGRTEDGNTAAEDSGQTPNGLPETGPANVLLSGMLLGGLIGAGVAYKRSRNLFTSL